MSSDASSPPPVCPLSLVRASQGQEKDSPHTAAGAADEEELHASGWAHVEEGSDWLVHGASGWLCNPAEKVFFHAEKHLLVPAELADASESDAAERAGGGSSQAAVLLRPTVGATDASPEGTAEGKDECEDRYVTRKGLPLGIVAGSSEGLCYFSAVYDGHAGSECNAEAGISAVTTGLHRTSSCAFSFASPSSVLLRDASLYARAAPASLLAHVAVAQRLCCLRLSADMAATPAACSCPRVLASRCSDCAAPLSYRTANLQAFSHAGTVSCCVCIFEQRRRQEEALRHGGKRRKQQHASQWLQQLNLSTEALRHEERRLSVEVEALVRSCFSAFSLTDKNYLGRASSSLAKNAGTTACLAIFFGPDDSGVLQLITAHAGDSRAVLCRDGEAIRLTEDHKPNSPAERKRIEKAGGQVRDFT
ncbi:protein phosphatase [Cyclospora cayetanensis]|uniref:Protein phosphatase n=1 Tax=Cyclospora cayetanensis TaxID=88456 RepID=A0A1D3CXZ8_9EIME|nr:protein phosphatase [Cyclospora cayetanensis]